MKRLVKEVMTSKVEVIPPTCKISDAARKMKEIGVGGLPICDGDVLRGMLTDRDIARIMEVEQIRRLVVLNRNKRLVGIISLGDVAVKTGRDDLAGEILEKVSEPCRPEVFR